MKPRERRRFLGGAAELCWSRIGRHASGAGRRAGAAVLGVVRAPGAAALGTRRRSAGRQPVAYARRGAVGAGWRLQPARDGGGGAPSIRPGGVAAAQLSWPPAPGAADTRPISRPPRAAGLWSAPDAAGIEGSSEMGLLLVCYLQMMS